MSHLAALLAVCGAATFKMLKSQVNATTFGTMDYVALARDTSSQSLHPLCNVSIVWGGHSFLCGCSERTG